MKVLIAPSAYKGTMSSIEVSEAIAAGIRRAYPRADIVIAPIADGGDGTIDALSAGLSVGTETLSVRGPVDELVEAKWIYLPVHSHAVVELASACGIGYLTGKKLQPFDSHTYGLGQVIAAALRKGVTKISICVGGSASTDGGSGMLRALGAKLLNQSGQEIQLGGGHLSNLQDVLLEQLESSDFGGKIKVEVVADVHAPLLGPSGAAAVFGPQKGASTHEDVARLEEGLAHFADLIEFRTGGEKRSLPGSGAAGGTAFGAMCVMKASLINGFAWLSEILDLERLVTDSDVVITAEGSLDDQSIFGKATGELGAMCQKHGKRLIALPAVAQAHVDWSRYGISLVQAVARANWIADSAQLSEVASTLLL